MAEPLVARSPLESHLRPRRHGRADGPPGIVLTGRPDLVILQVTARMGKVAAVRERLGVDLPERVNETRTVEGVTCFGIRPEGWLLVREDRSGRDGLYGRELARELAGLAAVVDQSHGRAVLRLGGPAARSLLQKGVPIDLHPQAFPPEAMAQTSLAGIAVLLHALVAPPAFELYVARSLAQGLLEWLLEQGADFGLEIAPA